MSNKLSNNTGISWNPVNRFILRAVFAFFLLQIVPVDAGYFRRISAESWPGLHYGDLFNIAHYYPAWPGDQPGFGDWLIYMLIAVAIATAWTFIDKNKTKNPDNTYYWFRTIIRYRLALAVIAYGFIKLYPLQAPYPSISNLNTNYGDYTRWKLFGLSLGIVPSYQSFLGGIEVLLGILLLFRKTASIAAFIVIVFTGNVFMSNLAYEGGETVYSFFLLSLAFFILLYDLQRLTSLLILQKPTAPNSYRPLFFEGWKQYLRIGLKISFFAVFVVLYGFKTKQGLKSDSFQYPNKPGLAGLAGIYNVSLFAIGSDTLAYSKTDPQRWSDVVFEKWNTISIRSNRPVIIDSGNVDRISKLDSDRAYEFEGSGGRHYYSYQVDSVQKTLTLENRNPHYKGEQLRLKYERSNDSTILLSGTNESNTPVYAVLQRLPKKYLLEEVAKRGRRKSFKL